MTIHDQPIIVPLQQIKQPTGELIIAEVNKAIPFTPKRQYALVTNEKPARRGAHSHKALEQFMICLTGQCEIELEGAVGKIQFALTDNHSGLYIPPGYWRDIKLAPNTCLSVLASEMYDEEDYIRNYDAFKNWLKHQSVVSSVPFIALDRCHSTLKLDLQLGLDREIDNNQLILGNSVTQFEANFAQYCDAQHAISCGNGLDALTLALKAAGIGAGDEVIVPANSFIATALAVEAAGATSVFIDCDLQTYGMDVEALENVITEKTAAIIPVHLYGIPVDMEKIMAIAEKHHLFVLEDAAQAHGALYKGHKVGSLGHAAALSFYPTKNLGALGDGGIIVANDIAIADKARLLANYGSKQKYHYETKGVNSRLDSLQAAFLNTKLPYLDSWNQKRRELATIYFNELSQIAAITLPTIAKNIEPVWHVFPIMLKDHQTREKLLQALQQQNIGTNIHYPIPIHQSHAYGLNISMPNVENLSAKTLSLPMDPFLTSVEIQYVCQAIKNVIAHPPLKNNVFSTQRTRPSKVTAQKLSGSYA